MTESFAPHRYQPIIHVHIYPGMLPTQRVSNTQLTRAPSELGGSGSGKRTAGEDREQETAPHRGSLKTRSGVVAPRTVQNTKKVERV